MCMDSITLLIKRNCIKKNFLQQREPTYKWFVVLTIDIITTTRKPDDVEFERGEGFLAKWSHSWNETHSSPVRTTNRRYRIMVAFLSSPYIDRLLSVRFVMPLSSSINRIFRLLRLLLIQLVCNHCLNRPPLSPSISGDSYSHLPWLFYRFHSSTSLMIQIVCWRLRTSSISIHIVFPILVYNLFRAKYASMEKGNANPQTTWFSVFISINGISFVSKEHGTRHTFLSEIIRQYLIRSWESIRQFKQCTRLVTTTDLEIRLLLIKTKNIISANVVTPVLVYTWNRGT